MGRTSAASIVGGGSGSAGNVLGTSNFGANVGGSVLNLGVKPILKPTGQMGVSVSSTAVDSYLRSSRLDERRRTRSRDVPNPLRLRLVGVGLAGVGLGMLADVLDLGTGAAGQSKGQCTKMKVRGLPRSWTPRQVQRRREILRFRVYRRHGGDMTSLWPYAPTEKPLTGQSLVVAGSGLARSLHDQRQTFSGSSRR
jgi:hypothetical protein